MLIKPGPWRDHKGRWQVKSVAGLSLSLRDIVCIFVDVRAEEMICRSALEPKS